MLHLSKNWFLSGLLMVIHTTATVAEELTEKSESPLLTSTAPEPLAMANLWQLTLGMLVVLGLIVGLAWLLKRSGKFQSMTGNGLRVLGSLSMSTREKVVLLQVGEQQVLVGVAPGCVRALHVLDHPVDGDEVTQPSEGFSDQLGRILKKEEAS